MTVTLRSTSRVDIVRRILAPGGLTSNVERYTVSDEDAYDDGDGDGQIDEVWMAKGSLAAGANETHDLQSLTQTDDNGATVRGSISFDGVKHFEIRNTTATSAGGFLSIGEAAANIWDGAGTPFAGGTGSTTGIIDVQPGDSFRWTSRKGGTVSGSAKDVKIAATTAAQTYELIIGGEKS